MAIALALALGLAHPLPAAGAPQAPAIQAPAIQVCHAMHPGAERLAASLSRRLLARMRFPRGVHVSLALRAEEHGVGCRIAGRRRTGSASIIKVALIAALGIKRADQGRGLSRAERVWARRAIRVSDNSSATRIWERLGGGSGFARYLDRLDMAATDPGPGTHWGRSLTSAVDQMGLLRTLQSRESAVPGRVRRLILRNMARVVSEQRWGISAGLAPGTAFAIKDGWVPLDTRGWRVNSIGIISATEGEYSLTILSDGNRSFSSGVRVVQRTARIVNRALDPS